MNCNNIIHNELKIWVMYVATFAMKKIDDTRVIVKRKTYCCDKKDLINDNQMYVCKNCGQIDRYKTKTRIHRFL